MVRGQRSNQLSYVPTCLSTTYKQVQQSTVFFRFYQRFARFYHFHRI